MGYSHHFEKRPGGRLKAVENQPPGLAPARDRRKPTRRPILIEKQKAHRHTSI